MRIALALNPRHALRLKHGRSASRLKPLSRTPCFCASSNSLHPPPAAVVLVTFKSRYQLRQRLIEKGIPNGIPFSMELITYVSAPETFQLVLCGVFKAKVQRSALLKNSPPDCFYLPLVGTVAFKSLSANQNKKHPKGAFVLELITGFEPVTSSLPRTHSTS